MLPSIFVIILKGPFRPSSASVSGRDQSYGAACTSVSLVSDSRSKWRFSSFAHCVHQLRLPGGGRNGRRPALYGLRRGEIAGLRRCNINLTDKPVGEGDDALPPKQLRVAENRINVGKTILTGTSKSKASNRTLPLPDEVVEVLKAARKRQLEERLAFGEDYGPGEYVASDETGRPYHPNLIYWRWGKMLDGLKIKRVRLRDARHTCGTLMHLRGVPIAVISAWLGHASAAFTMAVYAHSQTDALKAAGTSFPRVVTSGNTETGSPV